MAKVRKRGKTWQIDYIDPKGKRIRQSFKKKKDANIESILAKLRSNAMTYQGFVSNENLVKQEDESIVVMTSVWDRNIDWSAWFTSKLCANLIRELEPLLEEPPRVNIYSVKQ